jgi:hypothetical protein
MYGFLTDTMRARSGAFRRCHALLRNNKGLQAALTEARRDQEAGEGLWRKKDMSLDKNGSSYRVKMVHLSVADVP